MARVRCHNVSEVVFGQCGQHAEPWALRVVRDPVGLAYGGQVVAREAHARTAAPVALIVLSPQGSRLGGGQADSQALRGDRGVATHRLPPPGPGPTARRSGAEDAPPGYTRSSTTPSGARTKCRRGR